MSDLRWSEEADAVVNEDGTIVYRVSHEVGYMITEYHRLRVLAERVAQLEEELQNIRDEVTE